MTICPPVLCCLHKTRTICPLQFPEVTSEEGQQKSIAEENLPPQSLAIQQWTESAIIDPANAFDQVENICKEDGEEIAMTSVMQLTIDGTMVEVAEDKVVLAAEKKMGAEGTLVAAEEQERVEQDYCMGENEEPVEPTEGEEEVFKTAEEEQSISIPRPIAPSPPWQGEEASDCSTVETKKLRPPPDNGHIVQGNRMPIVRLAKRDIPGYRLG